MRRAVFHRPGGVRLDDVPEPEVKDGEVLVEVEACGLCSWEQRVYRGTRPRYPFAGGHEIGGRVVDAPGGDFKVGSVVAVSRLPRCGVCQACESGKDNLCAYVSGATADPDGPGGLTEFVVAADTDIVVVQGSPAEAALVEPLACVLNSLDNAGVHDGSTVAVLGNGFMGVLHARAATQSCSARVTLVNTHPTPLGLEGAWQGNAVDINDALSALGPSSVDATIVIRDVDQSLPLAAELTRCGGIISVFASLSADATIALPARALRRKELHLTAAASHRQSDFAEAARLISTNVVSVGDLIHREFGLDDVEEALEYAVSRDTGRVLVTPHAVTPSRNGHAR